MGVSRQCSKSGCTGPAVGTLTYVYRDSTAVLGPLATYAEPHTYDLCARHAGRLTVPRGWEVVRLGGENLPPPRPDDLVAVVEAVREVRRPRRGAAEPGVTGAPTKAVTMAGPEALTEAQAQAQAQHERETGVVEVGRRGHLRVLRDS